MGRKPKLVDPVVKTMRFPRKYFDTCPEDREFADWIRTDELGINPDGTKKENHEAVIMNGEKKALENIIAFYIHLAKSGKITAEDLELFSTINDDIGKIGGLIK